MASRTSRKGAAPSFDLASLPSIDLTPAMVSQLLLSSAAANGQSQASTASSIPAVPSSTSSRKRATRSKANSKKNNAIIADSALPVVNGTPSNIYATDSPTTTTKQDTQQNDTVEDIKDGSTEQQDGASGVVRRTCSHCGRLFKRASDCRRHERIHTNDKPHICPIADCSKAFVQKSALTTHMRTHTGEKPYTCRHTGCPRLFADASSRKKHESTHNKGDKRHLCTLCPNQAFRRRDTLNLHMRRMHPEAAGFGDGREPDHGMTSEFDADPTSDMEEDGGEEEAVGQEADELALLAFSSQPTYHSSSQSTAPSEYGHYEMEEVASQDANFSANHTFQQEDSLERSQSAPADEHTPSSPALPRASSAPIPENSFPTSNSLLDVASLFFDSSASASTTSSQSSCTSATSNTAQTSRYPFPYNPPPLHRSSLTGNNSDGENDSRMLSRNQSRSSTSLASDLFDILYPPSAPPPKTGNIVAAHTSLLGSKTAPQQRQPLTRVPSFGTPWAPGSPSKAQSQVHRDPNDMFT